MITIRNLEVRFEVEGDDDKKHFARMFADCIKQWSEAHERAKEETVRRMEESSLDPDRRRAH